MPRVIVWLLVNATITTYLAYRSHTQAKPISDDDRRQLYNDL
jgi:hypothetical protein